MARITLAENASERSARTGPHMSSIAKTDIFHIPSAERAVQSGILPEPSVRPCSTEPTWVLRPSPFGRGTPPRAASYPVGGGIAGACSPFLGRLRPRPPHPSISASPTTAPDRPLVSVLAAALAPSHPRCCPALSPNGSGSGQPHRNGWPLGRPKQGGRHGPKRAARTPWPGDSATFHRPRARKPRHFATSGHRALFSERLPLSSLHLRRRSRARLPPATTQ